MARTRPGDIQLECWESFIETHTRLAGCLSRQLEEEHGINMAGYAVLLALSRAPDNRLRQQDLVRLTLLTKSGVSRLVGRLETAGLVASEGCPSDRRGSFAVLTPTGRARFRRAAVSHLRGIEERFGQHLDDREASTLRTLLVRVGSAGPHGVAVEADCAGPDPQHAG